jgi:type VI protein secretion system component Hcp
MIAHDYPASPRARWPILLGLITVLVTGQVRANEWFVKIDGVPGQVTEGRFAGWTPVRSVGSLARVPIDPTNGVPGPASFACELKKAFDVISPALLQKCGEGTPFRRVSLAYVLPQPVATQYRITLDNVFVSSVGHDASRSSTDAMELEAVRLTFDRIESACFDLDSSGGTTGGLTAVLDRTTGRGQLKYRLPVRAVVTRQDGRSGVLVTWPGEEGHRYQILASAALGRPWTKPIEHTASEDGPASVFVPTEMLALFMRVEEVD